MSTLALPTVDEEIWRYSRIGELDLASFKLGKLSTKIDASSDAKQIVSATTKVVARASTDIFEELNGQHAQLTAITTAKNQVVAEPIVITHSLDESGVVAYSRLVVEDNENSEVTIVERFVSSANA
ncbi:MAG: hypothetical protein ACO3A0_03400, partial [Ilumatobacteraceae bacterium]